MGGKQEEFHPLLRERCKVYLLPGLKKKYSEN